MWLEYFEQYLDRVFPRFLSEKPWNYKDDLCMVGAEDLYCATGSESWREPVRRNASFLMDDPGRRNPEKRRAHERALGVRSFPSLRGESKLRRFQRRRLHCQYSGRV